MSLYSRLQRVIECLDSGSTEDWSISQQLRNISSYIYPDTKTGLFAAAIEKTWGGYETLPHVILDNAQAVDSRDRGLVDPSASRCFFVQLCETMNQWHSTTLRAKLDEKARLFRVYYRGMDGRIEEGVDWGGLYRDTMERTVTDLFSDHFSLFMRTPNHACHGANSEAFVPNPRHCTAPTLAMFEFVGKILGISFRHAVRVFGVARVLAHSAGWRAGVVPICHGSNRVEAAGR